MHIFDKDIADLYLSNVGDPIFGGHICTSQYLNPRIGNDIRLLLLVLVVKMGRSFYRGMHQKPIIPSDLIRNTIF